LRDLKAVAFLFSRDVAAIHRRLVLALFSADQDFAPEQRMPGIPDLAKLSLVGLVLWGCITTNDAGRAAGDIECRERLGGVLRYYYRRAA
jgi:hypothetical protein